MQARPAISVARHLLCQRRYGHHNRPRQASRILTLTTTSTASPWTRPPSLTTTGRGSRRGWRNVQAIATAYDNAGRTISVTSLNGSGAAVNQVQYAYADGLDAVTNSWQWHDGTVVEYGPTATPQVQYGYDNSLSLLSLTCPTVTATTGITGYYYYDNFSRVTEIGEQGTGPDIQTAVEYTYLGADTITGESPQEITGGLDFTLGNEDNGYSGLDQFGRVVDQKWTDDAATPTTLDEYKYGYDADGNMLWKQNATPGAAGLDEVYNYDYLSRLTGVQRGALFGQPSDPAITDAVFAAELDARRPGQHGQSIADRRQHDHRPDSPDKHVERGNKGDVYFWQNSEASASYLTFIAEK